MATGSKKLIQVYVDLLNLLECPVCFKYASSNEAPIKICTKGHFVCGDCVSQNFVSCPTCRGEYTNVRPTILDQIIEALAYPCRKVGCGTMLPIRDIQSHELQCNCPDDEDITYDKNMVQSQNLLKHIEDNYLPFYLKPDDITELGLCSNCVVVGLSEEDESPSRNTEQTVQNPSTTEELGNISNTTTNVPQPSRNNEDDSCLTVQDKKTKEVEIQCNLIQ